MICPKEIKTLRLTPLENKIENVLESSTNETKNVLKKKISTDIIKTKWIRQCPLCHKEQIYKKKKFLETAIEQNRNCISCALKLLPPRIKNPIQVYTRICHLCKDSITYSCQNAWYRGNKRNSACYSCSANKAVKTKGWDNETRLHKSCPTCQQTVYFKNNEQRRHSENNNKSCRFCGNEKRKESIMRNLFGKNFGGPHKPNYNPKACQYFNRLNLEKDWNLQHALNGGEIRVLNYCVDGYDKDRNIVVEYDEPFHYNRQGELKLKHILRQNRIINHLKCDFYRYHERKQQLSKC